MMKRTRTRINAETAIQHTLVTIEGAPFHALWTPEDEVVRAAGFYDARQLIEMLPAELQERGFVDQDSGAIPDALRAYASGDLLAIDTLKVEQPGPEFRSQVWETLRTVPAGEAVTYTELAALSGRPTAVRAAASSCATNLVALIVPCHRVTRSDGSIGEYGYGAALKERLLRHEGAID